MARTRGRLVRGVRRETLWIGVTPTNTNLTAGQATTILVLGAAGLALRPFTIVRTHIFWGVRSDQVATSENYAAGISGAVVSDQANAIGVTAVPTPITDIDSDMFWFWDFAFGCLEIGGTPTTFNELGTKKTIDSKAMRKVENGQDVAFVVEDEPTIGTDGCIVAASGRMLVKLH